jgi:hypothetical protein
LDVLDAWDVLGCLMFWDVVVPFGMFGMLDVLFIWVGDFG